MTRAAWTLRWGVFALAQACALPLAASIVDAQFFSDFALYDDEGYLMMIARYLLVGARPYDDVPTPYGPALHLVNWAVHGVAGLPLTHDAVRSLAAVTVLGSVLVLGAVLVAITGRVSIALLAQLVLLRILGALSSEPGHPQQYVALVIALSMLVACAFTRHPRRAALGLGVAVGVVLGLKVNLGVFVGAAAAIAIAAHTRPSRVLLALRGLLIVGAAALPWVLMRERLAEPWAMRFAAIVSLSVLPIGGLAWQHRRGRAGWAELGWLGFGALVAAVACVGFVLARGATIAAIVHSVWVMPQRLRGLAAPLDLSPTDLVSGFASVAAYLLWVGLARRQRGAAVRAALVGQCAAVALVLPWQVLPIWWSEEVPSLMPLAPWAWLAALRTHDTVDDGPGVARMYAVLASVLLPLWAYPVAGTQVPAGAAWLVVPWAIMAAEIVSVAAAVIPGRMRPLVGCATLGVVLLLIGFALAREARIRRTSYDALPALGLPGAERVHVVPSRKLLLRELTRMMRAAPDTFLCTDGLHSLYFWTGKEPPSRYLLGHDVDLYDATEQGQIRAALLTRPHARLLVTAWFPQHEKPFFRELLKVFEVERSLRRVAVMKRRGVAPIPAGAVGTPAPARTP